MSIPNFTMRQLLEAGIHFGHHPRRWNPKMEKFIFGTRNNVHIINLEHTYPLLREALKALSEAVAKGGRVLFVGTKTQATDPVAEAAQQCSQYFVNHRWLGGMMTNWNTVSKSIKRLGDFEKKMDDESITMTKKERLKLSRQIEKLNLTIGGIREMGGLPSILIVFDTNKETTAVLEARKLGIPVIGIVDTNCNPNDVDYPVPGNDDAIRSIKFFCDLFANTVIEGFQQQMAAAGVDMGESPELPGEEKAAVKKATGNKSDAKKTVTVEKKPAAKKTVAKPAAKKAVVAKSDDKAVAAKSDDKPAAKKAVAAKSEDKAVAAKKTEEKKDK